MTNLLVSQVDHHQLLLGRYGDRRRINEILSLSVVGADQAVVAGQIHEPVAVVMR